MITIIYRNQEVTLQINDFKRKGRGIHKIVNLMINEVKVKCNIVRMLEAEHCKLYQQIYDQLLKTIT